MAELKKQFLDFAGLSEYDELIKAYIDAANEVDQGSVDAVIAELAEYKTANDAAVAANTAAAAANTAALAVLNGTGEGSVAKQVSDAIAALIDNAPEALDTLKEIADWIANDETGTAALLNRVDDLEEADEELKAYVDAQDKAYYDSITAIQGVKIAALFPEKQAATQTAADAIAALDEGKAIELTADQEISENITINKSCYIDAKGSTFTGNVTVPADKEVVIVNATFSNPVQVV